MKKSIIENNFKYHAPTDRKIGQHKMIREAGKTFSKIILHNVPEGREQALAFTKIEEVVMWANAGIARSGDT